MIIDRYEQFSASELDDGFTSVFVETFLNNLDGYRPHQWRFENTVNGLI